MRRTRAAYALALEQDQLGVPGMRQFHAEAMKAARQHFGADEKAMATFGVERSKRGERHHRQCHEEGGEEGVTMVVEEVTVERDEPCREAPKSRCVELQARRGCEEGRSPGRGKRIPERGGKRAGEVRRGHGSQRERGSR